jgi:hypothetical protein
MPHSVSRTFEGPNSQLLGVPRERTMGERVHLEAAKLLVERRLLSLTGLAVALREAAQSGGTLALTLMASGRVAEMDYYRAVADVYGVRFVDLAAEPAEPGLVDGPGRSDCIERGVVPWRKIGGRLLIATTEISSDHFNWGDARFGQDLYDFVIASPLGLLGALQEPNG